MTDSDAGPVIVEKPARDVVPYFHGIWCSIGGRRPFVNEIVGRKWSDDGSEIWFMLDSHNFYSAKPDQMMRVVEIKPYLDKELLDNSLLEDAKIMSQKPPAMKECESCHGKGEVPRYGT